MHHDPDSLTCEKNSWREGRRIIEMGTLADNLKKGCGMCGNILQFSNILGERRFGLGQVLQIQCTNSTCLFINDVPTGSKHKLKPGMKQSAWDVNTKLAAGMLQGGYGATHVRA